MRSSYVGTNRCIVSRSASRCRPLLRKIRGVGEPAPDSETSPATLTGKERLGRKWMDEQRIDNCNVPLDKRGTKPRPSACPHVPMG